MCGFVGFMNSPSLSDPSAREKVLQEMTDTIRHRGPDDAHYYMDEQISLGFRRLSIIDLEGGRQPILNEDRSMALLFNGEIYNYRELRAELLALGHVFTTQSDSEVILHGYETYGEGILDRLRGMFAFVIWEKTRQSLFGARDLFGIKPFYYYQKGGEFFFGSEIKSFLPHPAFEKRLNAERIPEYLSYEYLPDTETMFKAVFKLPGAHCFRYENGQLKTRRYDQIRYNIDESKSLSQWAEAIQQTFAESVALHQISDVEVGCFLSSGVDSSYVVNEIAKGTKKVKTFSVGYQEAQYSELSYAQEFSRVVGVPNHSNKVSAEEFFDSVPEIQYFMDEPLPNPSEIPLYFLAKNARKHVKVVLSGEGADELFGGYPMYLAGGHFQRYHDRCPKPIRKGLAALSRHLPDFKGKNFLIRGAMAPYQRFMRANFVFQAEERQKFLKEPIRQPHPEEFCKEIFSEVAHLDEPTQLQYADIHTWMIYDILLKADRMSMAHSLELRVPFLDKEILSLALRIPGRFRADGEVTKLALRQAALRELPERTANKKKLGFPVPLNDWLREDKYYHRVKEAFTGEISQMFFVTEALMKLLDDHKAGKAKNMQKIWSFYSFIHWYDQFFVQR